MYHIKMSLYIAPRMQSLDLFDRACLAKRTPQQVAKKTPFPLMHPFLACV